MMCYQAKAQIDLPVVEDFSETTINVGSLRNDWSTMPKPLVCIILK